MVQDFASLPTFRQHGGGHLKEYHPKKMKDEEASVVTDGHDGQIWALSTSPTGTLFATGGYDNAVKVWDASTMKCIATHEFEINDDTPPKGL